MALRAIKDSLKPITDELHLIAYPMGCQHHSFRQHHQLSGADDFSSYMVGAILAVALATDDWQNCLPKGHLPCITILLLAWVGLAQTPQRAYPYAEE